MALGVSLLIHKHYLIPRTPLTWSTCTSERIRKVFDGDHPVLIYSHDIRLRQPDLHYYLEHPIDNEPSTEFRKLVSRENVELIEIAYGNDSGSEIVELMRILNKRFPDRFKKNTIPSGLTLILPMTDKVYRPSFQDDYTEFVMEKIRNK